MVRRLSRAERRAAFLRQAAEAFDTLETWCDRHPEATFAEIEQEARRERRTLLGRGLEVLINGRDSGVREDPPRCPGCGAEMELQDYRPKIVRGLEGESTLERAYYVCSQGCGETFFPPGPDPAPAAGSVE